jgi:hypothetical protein
MQHPLLERKKFEVFRVKRSAVPNRSASLFRFRGPRFAMRAENGWPPPALNHTKDQLFANVSCAGERTIVDRTKEEAKNKSRLGSFVDFQPKLVFGKETAEVPWSCGETSRPE